MLKKVMRIIVLLAIVLCATTVSARAQAAACDKNTLLISELQTGAVGVSGNTNFRYEFVELFNCSSTAVALEGYHMQFKTIDNQVITSLPLTGIITAEQFLWIGHDAYKNFLQAATPMPSLSFAELSGNLNALAAEGGVVVLTDKDGNEVDKVTYGRQADMAAVPPTGQSIKRCSVANIFKQTGNNAHDFVVTDLPTLSAVTKMGPVCNDQIEEPDVESCDGVKLNEILPNPDGDDKDKEFIELYNPTTKTINLKGCVVRLGETGKTFELAAETLLPNTYRTIYSSESNLTLPNKQSETVWLLGETTEESVQYAANLNEGEAWAFINEQWQATYQSTPAAANILLSQPSGKSTLPKEVICRDNEELNHMTNRCRKISQSNVVTCKAGQERNTETNRCRTITATANVVTPCQPGQERNHMTNRCRRIVTASESLKPCAEGQERNPETNRCKKTVVVNSPPLNKVEKTNAAPLVDPKWWLAGIALAGVIGYGLYEWRHDISRGLRKLKQKVSSRKTTM